jgi:glutamyl-tRNA synthetase
MNVPCTPLDDEARDAVACLLFPASVPEVTEITNRFPPRRLPDGALVTRFAPSPTGFIHIGSLMAALLNWKLAQQSAGVFILRIEDTDRRREVENGTALVVRALTEVGLPAGEGPRLHGDALEQVGDYGPYLQSERKPIYHAYARDLVRRGLAYPCFMSEDELAAIRAEQQAQKEPIGVYGKWARCRDLGVEDVRTHVDRGDPFVLRLRAPAEQGDRVDFVDRIRGPLNLLANATDTVLVKSDGLPTYHFAHPIDDTLMGVSIVIRGDEWISATPIHIQIFEALGMPRPPIAHIAPVAKLDGASRRKLSKRLDVEASMDYYYDRGYPSASIVEYLLNLLDSDFEEWRHRHPDAPHGDFPLSIDHLGKSSALFDLAKLDSVSRDVVARLTADELVAAVTDWAQVHDARLARALAQDTELGRAALNVGRDDVPPRKDLVKWADVPARHGFFFAELFEGLVPGCYAELPALPADELVAILRWFDEHLDEMLSLSSRDWHARVKAHAIATGYAANASALKQEPDRYTGVAGDVAMALRVVVTGSRQSPDLVTVMRILGPSQVRERIRRAAAFVAARVS